MRGYWVRGTKVEGAVCLLPQTHPPVFYLFFLPVLACIFRLFLPVIHLFYQVLTLYFPCIFKNRVFAFSFSTAFDGMNNSGLSKFCQGIYSYRGRFFPCDLSTRRLVRTTLPLREGRNRFAISGRGLDGASLNSVPNPRTEHASL